MAAQISNNDILLAILLMDASNRGYGQSMIIGSDQIGEATFFDDRGDATAQSAGSYAAA